MRSYTDAHAERDAHIARWAHDYLFSTCRDLFREEYANRMFAELVTVSTTGYAVTNQWMQDNNLHILYQASQALHRLHGAGYPTDYSEIILLAFGE